MRDGQLDSLVCFDAFRILYSGIGSFLSCSINVRLPWRLLSPNQIYLCMSRVSNDVTLSLHPEMRVSGSVRNYCEKWI